MSFPIMPFMKKVNIPRNGLIAEYLANNNFLDTSGNGYNGVNNNVTFGNDRKGKPNSAFVLNGTNAFINIDAAVAGLSTTTKGTWAAWVKPVDSTPVGAEFVITFNDTNAASWIGMDIIPSGKLETFIQILGSLKWDLQTDFSSLADNTWTHIAVVQNAIESIIYIDGVAVDQSFIASIDKTSWFNDNLGVDNGRIGDSNFSSGGEKNHFDGSIDDIRIYDRDLSQSEIILLANE